MTPDPILHVDVLRNEWSNAVQRLVARIELNGDLIVTDSVDEKRWTEILLGPERETETGEAITADHGKAYLELVVHDYERDTYYDVTEIHARGAECPVSDQGLVRMRKVEIS